jgi:hypothetical protein
VGGAEEDDICESEGAREEWPKDERDVRNLHTKTYRFRENLSFHLSDKTTGMVPDIIAFLEIVGGARESQNQKRKRDTVEFTLTKSCEQIRKKAVSNEIM